MEIIRDFIQMIINECKKKKYYIKKGNLKTKLQQTKKARTTQSNNICIKKKIKTEFTLSGNDLDLNINEII